MAVFFLLFIFVVFAFRLLVRKHLLIALLRLEFVVFVLHSYICFYLSNSNYSLIFFSFLCFLSSFLFVRFRWACLFWFPWFAVMKMIIFNLSVFCNVKASFFNMFVTFSGFWCVICSFLVFISLIYLFVCPYFSSWRNLGYIYIYKCSHLCSRELAYDTCKD